MIFPVIVSVKVPLVWIMEDLVLLKEFAVMIVLPVLLICEAVWFVRVCELISKDPPV